MQALLENIRSEAMAQARKSEHGGTGRRSERKQEGVSQVGHGGKSRRGGGTSRQSTRKSSTTVGEDAARTVEVAVGVGVWET